MKADKDNHAYQVWFFTQFSPMKETSSAPRNPLNWTHLVKSVRFQLERCPRTRRLHNQGTVILNARQRRSWLMNNLDDHAFWSPVKHANVPHALNYSMKEASRVAGPYSVGALIQSSSTTAQAAVEADQKKDMNSQARLFLTQPVADFALQHPGTYVRCHHGLFEFRRTVMQSKEQRIPPTCIWLHGDTRKALHFAQELAGSNLYTKSIDSGTSAFFDGYDPRVHRAIMIANVHTSSTTAIELIMQLSTTSDTTILPKKYGSNVMDSAVVIVSATGPPEDVIATPSYVEHITASFMVYNANATDCEETRIQFYAIVDSVGINLWVQNVLSQLPQYVRDQFHNMTPGLQPRRGLWTEYTQNSPKGRTVSTKKIWDSYFTSINSSAWHFIGLLITKTHSATIY